MERKSLILTVGVGLVAAAGGLGAGALLWGGNGTQTAGENTAEAHGEDHGEEDGAGDFVTFRPEDAPAAGVQLTSVARGGGGELVVPGRVAFAPGAEAAIGAPLAGVVQQVFVGTGANVAAGAPIALVRSPEAAVIRASADTARADVQAAQAAYAREQRLFSERVTARQDLEAARATLLRAQAALRSAQAQISATGASGAGGTVMVRAPIAGVVTSVAAAPGAALTQGSPVATIADASRLELIFDAPAGLSDTIRAGTRIVATIADGREVVAVVMAIAPNTGNSGAQVRARATGDIPPAGTPLSGRILTEDAATLSVPSEAIQSVGGRTVVFVVEANGFRVRQVAPGRVAGGRTEILRGLEGNERIAGRGAFLLKAELSRGEAEHDH